MLALSGVSFAPSQGALHQHRGSGLRQEDGQPAEQPSNSKSDTTPPLASTGVDATLPARINDPLQAPRTAGADNHDSNPQGQPPGLGSDADSDVPAALGQNPEEAQDLQELAQISDLARIDREVRAHEAAHAAAGGSLAGAPSFQYTRGPDGQLYATAGEVGIDTSKAAGDPGATIERARTVMQAALAPANPSAQDLRVAAQAQATLVEAQAELSRLDAEARVEEQAGEDPDAIEPNREDNQERLDRARKDQEFFAEQFQDFNQRLNDVQQKLIDAGAIETLDPEGVFLDILA